MVKAPFVTLKSIEARLQEGPMLSGWEFMRIHSNLNRMAGPLRQKAHWGTLTKQEHIDLLRFEDVLLRAKALYKPVRGPMGGLSMAEREVVQLESRKKRRAVLVKTHKRGRKK